MIRIDAVWLASEPLDMRADTALTLAVAVFGGQPSHAYLFANKCAQHGVHRAYVSPTNSR